MYSCNVMSYCVFRQEEIRHTIEIDDLLPSTSYSSRVAGGNQADLSHYSTPVRFTTAEEGMACFNKIHYSIYLLSYCKTV